MSADLESNEIELRNGIEVARAGHADILAVGNEVMLREDLTEDQLIDYIQRARAAVPGVPVGTVDAYFLFEEHPRVAAACDTLLVNCYPFWESCPAEYALLYMKEMYRRALNVADGKKVIISETGWPTVGSPFGSAIPSYDNALEYFIRTYQWADEEGIEIFLFLVVRRILEGRRRGRCRRLLGALGQGRQPQVCLALRASLCFAIAVALPSCASDRCGQAAQSRPGTQRVPRSQSAAGAHAWTASPTKPSGSELAGRS